MEAGDRENVTVFENFNPHFTLKPFPHFLTGNIKSSCSKRTVEFTMFNPLGLGRKYPTDSLRELPGVKRLGKGRIGIDSKSNLLSLDSLSLITLPLFPLLVSLHLPIT